MHVRLRPLLVKKYVKCYFSFHYYDILVLLLLLLLLLLCEKYVYQYKMTKLLIFVHFPRLLLLGMMCTNNMTCIRLNFFIFYEIVY